MRILLLAYACEPNRGSEPGIGWKWAVTLAGIGHEVHVITRANNKGTIDKYWNENPSPNQLHFHYYDCPEPLLWAKHHALPVNIYYACWLNGASSLAEHLNDNLRFDVAHHITFGVYRFLPRLYKLNIPVVIGPVGGGEYIPKEMLPLYTRTEKLKELMRYVANKATILHPAYHKALNQASLILTKTNDTLAVLQKQRWRDKAVTILELGIDSLPCPGTFERNRNQFLFVGRFTYWKGIKLALEAFSKYCRQHDDTARLIFIGKGEMEDFIMRYAEDNGLGGNIEIVKWMDQKELIRYYQSSCALLFPSMHDSSGNVVLESLANGLPVVCLHCGGPVSVMGALNDTMVNPCGKSIGHVVDDLVGVMHKLTVDDSFYNAVKEKAILRASEFIWKEHVSNVYSLIVSKLRE